MTRGSLHSLPTYDALGAGPLLATTPLLVVHGASDAYRSPELASDFYARGRGPQEQFWLDTDQHIDLYDVEEYITPAVDAAAAFLHSSLPPVLSALSATSAWPTLSLTRVRSIGHAT